MTRSEWGTATDRLTDDELEDVVRMPAFHEDRWLFGRPPMWDFWDARPATCERIAARVLATTGDSTLAGALVKSSYNRAGG